MALLDHDEAGADEDDAKPGTKDAKKKHKDNLIIIAIALVGVILTYLIYRANKNAAAASTTTTTPPPSSGQLVGGSGTTNSTDPYAEAGINQLTGQLQQQGQAVSGLQSLLTTLQSEVGQMQASPPAAAAPTAAATPATPGYGYINLPGIGQSVILGNLTNGGYSGYEAGGGAPVYFGNANAVSQGSGQETAGNYAYTPVAYAGLVSPSAASGGPLPGQH